MAIEATDMNLSVGSLNVPAESADDIVPSNTDELIHVSRGIYVGVTGNIKIKTLKGSIVTFVAVPAGTILPVRARQVFVTGTTSSSLIALW